MLVIYRQIWSFQGVRLVVWSTNGSKFNFIKHILSACRSAELIFSLLANTGVLTVYSLTPPQLYTVHIHISRGKSAEINRTTWNACTRPGTTIDSSLCSRSTQNDQKGTPNKNSTLPLSCFQVRSRSSSHEEICLFRFFGCKWFWWLKASDTGRRWPTALTDLICIS